MPAARASRPTTRRSVFHRTQQIGIRVALFVAISGLGLAAVSAGQQGTTTGFLDRSIALGGATYRYQVYLPAEYTPEKEWPVLVDLHGNGAQGSDGIRQTAHFLADEIRMHRSRFPLIAVFPQAAVSNSWVTGAMPEMVDAEVGATLREFRIDVDRVYLSGFSMGGEGVYTIAARSPERFAAAFAIAGPVRADVKTLAQPLRSLPIHIFHGADDERVDVEQSRRLVAELKRVGSPVIYTEYAATHHGPAAEKAYGDESLYRWLLAQRRPGTKPRQPKPRS